MPTRQPALHIGAPLVDAIDQLISSEFRRVLIQEAGRLVGVIVRSDLMPTVLVTLEDVAARRTL